MPNLRNVLSFISLLFMAVTISACNSEGKSVQRPAADSTEVNTPNLDPVGTDDTNAANAANADNTIDSFLTAEQKRRFPDDCLFAKDGANVVYCFSPATRKYTAVSPDGSVHYDFILPGDNTTNAVKGLFIGPDESGHDVCLIADVTLAVGASRFEISCFTKSGAFVKTMPTLTTPPRLGAAIKSEEPQGININNEPLLVTQGAFGRVIVAGTRYRIDPLSDPSQKDLWQPDGNFVASLDPITGRRFAVHDYPNRTVVSLDKQLSQIAITFSDNQQTKLDAGDLGPIRSELPSTRASLSPDRFVRAMPTLMSILDGAQFEQVADLLKRYTDTLIEKVDETNRWPLTPECPLSGPPGCEQTVTGVPITIACSVQGTAIVTFATLNRKEGSVRSYTQLTDWVFNNCEQSSGEQDRTAVLNGQMDTESLSFTSSVSAFDARYENYENLSFNSTIYPKITVSGSWSVEGVHGRKAGSYKRTRLGNFSQLQGLKNTTLRNASIGQSVTESRGNNRYAVSDPEQSNLGFSIDDAANGFSGITVVVSTALRTSFLKIPSGYLFSDTRGVVEVAAQDGSRAIVSLSTDAPNDETSSTASTGRELATYRIEHDGLETHYVSSTAGFYVPWFVD